jgi:hypothetical protein
MTRTWTRLSVAVLVATLGPWLAWAGEKREGSPELLPAPQRCCQETTCPSPDCCKAGCCPAGDGTCDKAHLTTKIFSVAAVLPCDKPGEKTLIKLITDQVQPSTWAAAGGQGTIEYMPMGKVLVVTQSAEAHEQIAKLLPLLRRLQECTSTPTSTPADAPARVFVFAAAPEPQLQFVQPAPEPQPAPPAPPFGPRVFEMGFASAPCCQPGSCPMAVFGSGPAQPAAQPCCPGVGVYMSGDGTASCVAPAGMAQPAPAPVMPPPMFASSAAWAAPPVFPPPPMVNRECWRMQAVTAEGKTKLAVHCDCNMCMTCESLEITMPANNRLQIATSDKQLCATGSSLHATADAISCHGQNGCVVFEGHVNLRYQKSGQRAMVSAQRVTVNLANGQVEMQPAVSATDMLKRVSFTELLHSSGSQK